jgi:putative acetyltransferase
MISIIPFEPIFTPVFRRLNMDWLDAYALTEAHDLVLLDDPVKEIIDPGGCIFLAAEEGEIVGCAGLMKTGERDYELVKMTVVKAARGRGISKLLLQRCIDQARENGGYRLTLLSNHQLTEAISLYTRFGFTHIPLEPSPFALADVHMQLLVSAAPENTESSSPAPVPGEGQTN